MALDTGTVTVSGIDNPSYAGGFTSFRYLARQTSDFTIENTTDKSVQTFYGNDHIKNFVSSSKIITGTGNDTVHNSSLASGTQISAGTGNDSLWDEAGNGSLWGGSGKDTFIYTANEGTDTIFDYETGDMLKILKTDGSDGSFKKSKFSDGDLTLTINGGGKVIFDDVSASTQFNINGMNYKISGTKLKKQ